MRGGTVLPGVSERPGPLHQIPCLVADFVDRAFLKMLQSSILRLPSMIIYSDVVLNLS